MDKGQREDLFGAALNGKCLWILFLSGVYLAMVGFLICRTYIVMRVCIFNNAPSFEYGAILEQEKRGKRKYPRIMRNRWDMRGQFVVRQFVLERRRQALGEMARV